MIPRAEPTTPIAQIRGRKLKKTGYPKNGVLHVRMYGHILSELKELADKCKADGLANWSQADIVYYALRQFLRENT